MSALFTLWTFLFLVIHGWPTLSSETCAYGLLSDVEATLGIELSSGASIVFPDNEDVWEEATERWSSYREPKPGVSIRVESATDVQKIVDFSRAKGIPVLVRNRGHGSVGTLETFVDGIQIDVSGLTALALSANGTTVELGGGAWNYQIITELYKLGKQTSVGSCSCVGFMGALLGGGHGRLQGLHGLMADNLVSAEVVLADGSLVEASASNNPDLLWALKGAGHNFGVVTSASLRVFDLIDEGTWWFANYVFLPSSLADVFNLINEIRPTQPAELTMAAQVGWLDPSSTQPMVLVVLYHAGNVESMTEWTSKFEAINPVDAEYGTAQFDVLSEVSFTGVNSTLCATGYRRNHYPASLKTLDVAKGQAVLDLLTEMGEQYPDLKSTYVIYECYSTQAVKAVPEDSTAYPHRSEDVIALFQGVYTDPIYDGPANEFGQKIRTQLQSGSGYSSLQTYVNYAQGDESFSSVYGDDTSRRSKLLDIKKKYDPTNMFGFYEPVS